MLMLGSLLIAAVISFFVLKKKSNKTIRSVPPIEDVLLTPEKITVNIYSYKTPPLSGYPLAILSYIYHTTFGRILVSRFIIPMSNLNLFSDRKIPELPSLTHSEPPPCFTTEKTESILISLLSCRKHDSKHLSSADFYNAYKSGQTTPLEVANSIMAAIEDSNSGDKPLRAIVSVNRELILSMAESSTERWKNGSQLSLIDGVPISVKEDFNINGYSCNCGAAFNLCPINKKSSTIQKFIDLGAIIIGLTNMPELGSNSVGSCENKVHGQTRNPHNIDFFCGGSSTGCGASVAAGLCPISIGGDGGGSGRVPAAVCGVYALLFTAHLTPVDEGYYGSMFSFSTVSPITNSAADLAVCAEAICGKKSAHDYTLFEEIGQSLSGLTVGVYTDWINKSNKENTDIFNSTIEKMKMLGAQVKNIKIPELEEVRVAHTITAVTELASANRDVIAHHFSDLGPGILIISALGQYFSAIESINAMKQRTRSIKALKSIFSTVDVIATPTTGCQIPRITSEYLTPQGSLDGDAIGKLEMFTFLSSFTGLPSITIPIGATKCEGLPVGMQLIAPWYKDLNLVKYAVIMEASGIVSRPSPVAPYNILH